MSLFDQIVTPAHQAISIGAARTNVFRTVFPSMPTPDATGLRSNPATAQHLLPANSPAAPPPAPVIHLSAAARAAQAVAAHLAANPPPPKTPYVTPTRYNTPLAQSMGTRNTNFANSVIQAGGTNARYGGTAGIFAPQTPDQILSNNPLAPKAYRVPPPPTPGFSSAYLNTLFPRT